MHRYYISAFILPLLISCSVSRQYDPNKKYSKEQLQKDFVLLRNVLEKKHPALYWYTPREQMNEYFDKGYEAINDSMTELQFGWRILAPLTAVIHCGHTSFSMSRGWNHFIRDKHIPSFPLALKIWKDTMMVVGHYNRKDSGVPVGSFITSINGLPNRNLIDNMFDYLSEDGYANNVKYIRLSESFPYYHRNVFGLYQNYAVTWSDSLSQSHHTSVAWYAPSADSSKKIHITHLKARRRMSPSEKRGFIRNVKTDSSTALMTVNSFSKGHLNHFFKSTFRSFRKKGIRNLIIDLRVNGGGEINNSVLLTKFIKHSPFKVADTAYSIAKGFAPFTRHISTAKINNLGFLFLTRKRADGNYHFGFWEKHFFHPKRKNHFDGHVYVITNGLTFSASTLFCNAVKGQENVTLVGEETGGGWYGNSGIVIPDILLPRTKLIVRLPFFKIVQYQHVPVKGTGVIPDIMVTPVWRDILKGVDTKKEVIKELIMEKSLE